MEATEAQFPALREELNKALIANGDAAIGPGSGEDLGAIDVDAMSDDLSSALASKDKKISQHQRDRLQNIVRVRSAMRDLKFILHHAHFMRGVLMGKLGAVLKGDEGPFLLRPFVCAPSEAGQDLGG